MQKKNESANISAHENAEICCETWFPCLFILQKEVLQAISVSIVLLQMENEQCGIARVFLGSPFVIVGGEYVANQPVGRLPLRGERDDLRGVSGDYMLYSLLHVVD